MITAIVILCGLGLLLLVSAGILHREILIAPEEPRNGLPDAHDGRDRP